MSLKIRKIILYDEPRVAEIQIKKLAGFLAKTFPVQTEIRDSLFRISDEKISERIAGARIFDLKKPLEGYEPASADVSAEMQDIDIDEQGKAVPYDGFELYKTAAESIPADQNRTDTLHVIFTDRLMCTFDENDSRYHARALIGSNPAIISTTGMIEAPAKSRQYYLDLMTCFSGEDAAEIKKRYRGEFLEYHDSRTSHMAERYLLQAVMYFETGEAFCADKDCGLFNAHWQKELFCSQTVNRGLCKRHQEMLHELKDGPSVNPK